jgi:HD-GYP domain-containing protein (c-di-GMP phosphodiesterase class II)
VARYTVGIAEELGLDPVDVRRVRRAALLHDLGKLGVSSAILDKPGRLTDAELDEVRRHPDHTLRILERVAPFRDLAEVAAMHHERVDGRGYHRGVGGAALPLEARILAVADQFEALSAERPYRERLDRAQVLAILERDLGTGIDADVFAALRRFLEREGRTTAKAAQESAQPRSPVLAAP